MTTPLLLPVKLHHPASQRVESIGPVGRVVVDGDILILDEQDVAIYGNGLWVFKGESFTTVLIEARVSVHFEDAAAKPSNWHGPFDQLKIVDGAILYGDEFKQLLAQYDEHTKQWQVEGEPGEWLKAFIAPA